MLVLTRKPGEKVFVGDKIVITVIESDRGRTRIGIEAPKEIPIEREEVRARKDSMKHGD